jgi:hypothetical protein
MESSVKLWDKLLPGVDAEEVKSVIESAASPSRVLAGWPYYCRPRPDPIFTPMPMLEPTGKVFYTSPPEPWCTSPDHPGRGGPCSACTHDVCMIRTVMEE